MSEEILRGKIEIQDNASGTLRKIKESVKEVARGAQEAKEKLESLEGVRLSPKEIAISDSMVDSALRKLREIESIKISAKKAPVDGSMVEEVLGSLREIGEVDIPPQKIEVESDALEDAAERLELLNGVTEEGIAFFSAFTATLSFVKGTMEALNVVTEFAEKGQKALNGVLSAAQWGVVGLAIGAVVGIISLLASNTKGATKETNALNEALKENAERYEKAKKSAADHRTTQLANAGIARDLRAEIQTLNDQTYRTAEEQNLLNQKIDWFKQIVPDAVDLISEQNGQYTIQWQEIDKVISKMEEQAKVDAYKDLIKIAAEGEILAQMKYEEADEEVKRLEKELEEKEEKLAQIQAEDKAPGKIRSIYEINNEESQASNEIITAKDNLNKAISTRVVTKLLYNAAAQNTDNLMASMENEISAWSGENAEIAGEVTPKYIQGYLKGLGGQQFGEEPYQEMLKGVLALQNEDIERGELEGITAHAQQYGILSSSINGSEISGIQLRDTMEGTVRQDIIDEQMARTSGAEGKRQEIAEKYAVLSEQKVAAARAGDIETERKIGEEMDALAQQDAALKEEIEDAGQVIQEAQKATGEGLVDLCKELVQARTSLENFELKPYGGAGKSEGEIQEETKEGNVPLSNATGTAFSQGGTTLVGEHGPELVEMPTGARVHSKAETASMLRGGSSIYLTISNNTFEIPDEAACDRYTEILVRKLQRAALNM